MEEEKFLLNVAVRDRKLLTKVVEAGLLPEYQDRLDSLYQSVKKANSLPDIQRVKELFNIEIENIDKWDVVYANKIADGYISQKEREEYSIILNGSESWKEDFQLVRDKYQKYDTEEEQTRLVLACPADYLAAAKALVDTSKKYLRTGYPSLAQVLNNSDTDGWRPGTLTTFVGLSGTGKSIFLVNISRDMIENGYNVLYLTTEMTEPEIFERLAKSLSNSEDCCESSIKYKSHMGKCIIEKVLPGSKSTDDIEVLIRDNEFPFDAVIVDYADELKSQYKSQSEYDAQGFIYQGLKKLSMEYNIPIVTATQANRTAAAQNGGTQNRIGSASIADSYKKVRLVDTLFTINQTREDKELETIFLYVEKNRKNATGQKIQFFINYKHMRLFDKGIVNGTIVNAKEENMEEKKAYLPKRSIS